MQGGPLSRQITDSIRITESQRASPPTPHFQFRLRTLLLLFMVLASSMAVFGARGTGGGAGDQLAWGAVVQVFVRGKE